MKKWFPAFYFLLISSIMHAQTAIPSPAGEYYLRGVMETASGFKLNPDSSFQFFFSYGSLDRFGSGKWTVNENHILFNSRKKPDADFRLTQSKKTEDKNITVKIADANEMVKRHFYCLIQSGNKKQEGMTNSNGSISFPSQPIDSITLLFEFCPEKKSVFTLSSKDLNYFEFRIEPWMMEVFFDNFSLQMEDHQLTGKHPLLDEKVYSFEKSGN